jgi:putative lipoic acid-binding regulatory protein
MIDRADDDLPLEFPLEVHFRILCLSEPAVLQAVREAADLLGLSDALREGNHSRGGRYTSFQLSLQVESREELRRIDQTFRQVEGVKMVL